MSRCARLEGQGRRPGLPLGAIGLGRAAVQLHQKVVLVGAGQALPGIQLRLTVALLVVPQLLQDLLGREPIQINIDEIRKYISGKVIMVTGGGGSIGSELCRQIAKSNPKQLLIFDIYENNAYDIQMELKRKYPALDLVVLIGSVRNTARLDVVLGKYRPEIVFHAAAHKHVPLMEDSPNEAIKNNVFGTYKMAQARRQVRRQEICPDLHG